MVFSQNTELLNHYVEEINKHYLLDTSFSQYMRLSIFEESEYIYQQEDFLEHLYIFVHGSVKVSHFSENGKETIFRILKQPRIMGEIEFLLNSPATCTTQALDPVHCILLPLHICGKSLLQDSIFLKYISINLAEALSVANTITSINQCYSPKARLISYILSIEKNGCFYFDFAIVSKILGISERHLFRIMSNLIQDSFLMKTKSGYKILNRDELIAISKTRYLL